MFYYDGNLISISQYQKVLLVKKEEISIRTKQYDLIVSGQDLWISLMNKAEICIKGKFEKVTFNELVQKGQ